MIPLTNGGILSAEDILQETAKRYALGIDDLLGPSRETKTRRARREWWQRLRKERDMSWNEIARVVGRHPRTVRDVLSRRKRKARAAWLKAFRKYAADRFGDRCKYAEIDPDWFSSLKVCFRAGYRAGVKDQAADLPPVREKPSLTGSPLDELMDD